MITIVDGPFFAEAVRSRTKLKEDLQKLLLDHKTSFVTTRCVIEEISKLGKEFEGARFLARKTRKVKCRHRAGDLEGRKCILKNVRGTNPLHYMVGTQDKEVIKELRKRHVPIIHFTHGALHLEKPSTSKKITEKDEESEDEETPQEEKPSEVGKDFDQPAFTEAETMVDQVSNEDVDDKHKTGESEAESNGNLGDSNETISMPVEVSRDEDDAGKRKKKKKRKVPGAFGNALRASREAAIAKSRKAEDKKSEELENKKTRRAGRKKKRVGQGEKVETL